MKGAPGAPFKYTSESIIFITAAKFNDIMNIFIRPIDQMAILNMKAIWETKNLRWSAYSQVTHHVYVPRPEAKSKKELGTNKGARFRIS